MGPTEGSGGLDFELANKGENVFEFAKTMQHMRQFEGPTGDSEGQDVELANRGKIAVGLAKTL